MLNCEAVSARQDAADGSHLPQSSYNKPGSGGKGGGAVLLQLARLKPPTSTG